ncbi:MAG TPA: zf-HC2 domain-containing protein [candidate division Zixibacteria bacterium]|nr:zf-HC2 domain-containing protein [candidate division Zixibacteria bacterium]
MTCQEARDLLYEIIDKEASEIDVKQVQEHLSKCRHCSEIYDLEIKLNQLIAARLGSEQKDNSACVSRLRDRILVDLDKIDEELGGSRKRPFEFAAKTLVAAA